MEKKGAGDGGPGEVEDASKSPSSSSSHKPAKPGRLPTNIIRPASFLDTVAVLSLFMHMPPWLMISIHMLFLASYFSSSNFSIFSARSMLGWTVSGGVKAGGSTSLSGMAFFSAILRVLGIDFAVAITTLYLAPLLRNVVMILAHAVVAASLGGGPKVFTNAIYATTLIEVAYFVWEKVCQNLWASDMAQVVADAGGHHRQHHGHATYLHPELDGLLLTASGEASFNTITSTWTSLSNVVRFIRHMDWVGEVPLICFQLVAVHVVGLCLLPYIRNVFHDGTRAANADTAESVSASDSYVDSAFVRGLVASSSSTSTAASESPTTALSVPQGPSVEIAVPQDLQTPPSLEGDDAEADEKYQASDFDFLYAPAGKKNKRLAMIRANQPLWSTLASSIILAARQETGGGTDESMGLNCYVRFLLDNLVAFVIDGDVADAVNVSVNGIQWPQVCFYAMDESGHEVEDEDGANGPSQSTPAARCIMVVIYGLTPLTQYEIAISAASTGQQIMHTNISTVANSSAAQSIGAPLARSVSPVTTLLDTLASTQVTLSEEKSRLKKSRKEHTKRLASLRSEIDAIRSKLDAADKGDERNRRKLLSLREAVRQLEEEVETLSRESDELESQHKAAQSDVDALESEWNSQLKVYREKEAVVKSVRSGWDKKIAGLETELSTINGKRDKLSTKKQRLAAELEKAEKETLELASKDALRRQADRAVKLERRRKLEEEFSISITKMEKRARELKALPIYSMPAAVPMEPQSTI